MACMVVQRVLVYVAIGQHFADRHFAFFQQLFDTIGCKGGVVLRHDDTSLKKSKVLLKTR